MVILKTPSYLTNDRIEGEANKILYSLEQAYTKIIKPPIPIDTIVEQLLDLNFDWDDILDDDKHIILGCLEPNNKRILMNTRRLNYFTAFWGSEAYTKAHEVGHWCMHVAKADDTYQLALPGLQEGENYLCRDGKSDPREIQAEKFAAFLLMPRHLILQEIEGLDLTKWPTLYRLRDLFGVSITAMKNRLTGMGLIYVVDKQIFHSEVEANGCVPLL